MLGAYTTYVVQDIIRARYPGLFDASLFIAVPLAFVVAGAGRDRDRAHHHPLPLWTPARNIARDLGLVAHPAAGGAQLLRPDQQGRRQSVVDERRVRAPVASRSLITGCGSSCSHSRCSRCCSACCAIRASASRWRAVTQNRQMAASMGNPHSAHRRADLRARLGHRGDRGRRALADRQRQPQPRQGYINRLIPRRGVPAASAICGARSSAPSRSASPTSSSSRSPARCLARFSSWSRSSCSSRSVRAGCSPSRAGRWRHDRLAADPRARPRRGRLHPRADRGRRRGAAAQSADAGGFAVARADLSGRAVGKYVCYAIPRAFDRFDLGLLRHSLARPTAHSSRSAATRWDVPDAPDRYARRLRQPDPAGLPGVPELAGASGLLVRLPALPLCAADGVPGAGALAFVFGLVRVPARASPACTSRLSRRRSPTRCCLASSATISASAATTA